MAGLPPPPRRVTRPRPVLRRRAGRPAPRSAPTAARLAVLPILALLVACGTTATEPRSTPTATADGTVSAGSTAETVPATPAPTTAAPTVAPTSTVPATPAPTTLAPTTVAPTTIAPTTVAPTTAVPSTLPPPTTAPLPIVPLGPGPLDLDTEVVGLGFSVEGRPIFAERYGTPGGRRVLVVGVIHGNEDDGLMIVDELRRRPVPDGIELWLVDSMNPDGVARQDRHNANEVDLNRNFPYRWGPIGSPGDSQYAGVGPASEPETQAMVNFVEQLRPDIAIWYHQDAFLVIPSTGRDGRIRARYAELTGLPLADCCGGGGIYTGIAATWARQELSAADGVAFIVELGGTTSPEEVSTHADAVLTIAAEG